MGRASKTNEQMEICHKESVDTIQRMEVVLGPPTLVIGTAHGELASCVISSVVQANEHGQQMIPGFFTCVFVMFTGPCTHIHSLIKHLLGTSVFRYQLCVAGRRLRPCLHPKEVAKSSLLVTKRRVESNKCHKQYRQNRPSGFRCPLPSLAPHDSSLSLHSLNI